MKTSLESPLKSGNTEGPLTDALERQMAVPGDAFLWASAVSIIGSLTLRIMGRPHASLFVGQWAPTFLLLAIYRKLAKGVKTEGALEEIASEIS